MGHARMSAQAARSACDEIQKAFQASQRMKQQAGEKALHALSANAYRLCQ
jgi:hypothetical protein